MKRRISPWKCAAAAAGLLAVLLPLSCCVSCPSTLSRFEWQYRYRVHDGMTLEEVQARLGPGEVRDAPPGTPDYRGGTLPLVRGERSHVWERDGMEIWVGLRGGKVCDKWFWFPSL